MARMRSHLNPVNFLKTGRIFREPQDYFFSAQHLALIAINALTSTGARRPEPMREIALDFAGPFRPTVSHRRDRFLRHCDRAPSGISTRIVIRAPRKILSRMSPNPGFEWFNCRAFAAAPEKPP